MSATDTQTKHAARRRLTLAAVIAVFAMPILIAWWFAHAPPASLSQGLVNHGRLIEPPIAVHTDTALAPLADVRLAPGEWAMVAVAAGACDSVCLVTTQRLLDVRTVLGQAATRTRVVLLADEVADTPAGVVPVVDPQARAALARALPADAPVPAIVLLDFRGSVVMHFPADADPGAVKADLKRLLRASKVR